MNKLKDILNKKYGKKAVNLLLTDNYLNYPLSSENLHKFNNAVKEHFSDKIINNLLTYQEWQLFEKIGWGFDFSGWIGPFIECEGKKLMIIGSEPHICKKTDDGKKVLLQIVYDFYQKVQFSNDIDIANYYIEKGLFIWKRIAELFGNNNDLAYNTLLNTYITDLCPFAPYDFGTVSRIKKKIPRWDIIRKNAMSEFLMEEIDVVKPKKIICQGGNTFIDFVKHLGTNITDTIYFETGFKRPKKYSIRIVLWKDKIIYGIPHIGSTFNMTKTFWNRNLYKVREDIKNKGYL